MFSNSLFNPHNDSHLTVFPMKLTFLPFFFLALVLPLTFCSPIDARPHELLAATIHTISVISNNPERGICSEARLIKVGKCGCFLFDRLGILPKENRRLCIFNFNKKPKFLRQSCKGVYQDRKTREFLLAKVISDLRRIQKTCPDPTPSFSPTFSPSASHSPIPSPED